MKHEISSSSRGQYSPTSSLLMRLIEPHRKRKVRCSKQCKSELSLLQGSDTHWIHHSLCLLLRNPIEQEGTYPLPEAQLDRFMYNIWVDYPTFEEEVCIVKSTTSNETVTVSNVMEADEILFFQELVRKVPVPDGVIDYAVKLANSTRPSQSNSPEITNEFVNWGAGTKGKSVLNSWGKMPCSNEWKIQSR